MTHILPEIPTEALNEASEALAAEYEQPAAWHLDDARLVLEPAQPALWHHWRRSVGGCDD